jgi:hypothetical protein
MLVRVFRVVDFILAFLREATNCGRRILVFSNMNRHQKIHKHGRLFCRLRYYDYMCLKKSEPEKNAQVIQYTALFHQIVRLDLGRSKTILGD